jgi:hypothetical protein
MLEIRESATSDTFTAVTKRVFSLAKDGYPTFVRLLRVNDRSTRSWHDGTRCPRERQKVREARG